MRVLLIQELKISSAFLILAMEGTGALAPLGALGPSLEAPENLQSKYYYCQYYADHDEHYKIA